MKINVCGIPCSTGKDSIIKDFKLKSFVMMEVLISSVRVCIYVRVCFNTLAPNQSE